MILALVVVLVVLWLVPAMYCRRVVHRLEKKSDLFFEFASHSAPYRPRTILLVGAWIPVFNWKLARELRNLWIEVIRDMELQRFEELRRR